MDINGRPNHIEDALTSMYKNQWFTWTDSKNKIYANLRLTEKIENPRAEIKPKTKPNNDPFSKSPIAIINIPIVAIAIAIHTFVEIFSLRNKKPNNAVIKGIAARHKSVIAAVVFVIDQINDIIAIARPTLPIAPDNPIFK